MGDRSSPGSEAAAITAGAPAMIASASLVAQLVGGKALRDALFLTHFGVGLLAQAMIGSAILSAIAVLVMARAVGALGPARVVPASFAASSLSLLGAALLSLGGARGVTLAIYVHAAVFGQALGSAFWSLVNERLDPHEAKRLVGRIASGGTVGGILGGAFVWVAATRLSVPSTLLALAAVSAVGLWASLRLAPRAPAPSRVDDARSERSGFEVLAKTPYLQDLALLVGAGAAVQALLDWLLGAHAALRLQGQELVGFFAVFNTAANVLSFFAQVLVTRTMLERRGLGGTMKMHPLTTGAAALVTLVAPVFVAVVGARVVEQVTRSSLYRSAYELFYTPLPTSKKRSTKMLIDVGVDRVGTTLGSACVLVVAQVGSRLTAGDQLELQSRVALVGVLALTVTALYIAPRLQRGYVTALAASLRSGAVTLAEDDVIDGTTRRTLAETSSHLGRDELLARIADLRAQATTPERDTSTAELLSALDHSTFEVRVEAARAFTRLVERSPWTDAAAARAAYAQIMDVVRRELTAGRLTWPRKSDVRPSSEALVAAETARRGLDHVFVVLGLAIDREPLTIAYRALRGDDPALRGTALEYLDVVLPDDVRDLLMPLLGEVTRARSTTVRDSKIVAAELLRSRG